MARQHSVAHAKNNLPALIHDAEHGTPVEITRRGRPVAVLVSVSEFRRMRGLQPDLWAAIQRLRAENDLTEIDVDEFLVGTRARSGGREFSW